MKSSGLLFPWFFKTRLYIIFYTVKPRPSYGPLHFWFICEHKIDKMKMSNCDGYSRFIFNRNRNLAFGRYGEIAREPDVKIMFEGIKVKYIKFL